MTSDSQNIRLRLPKHAVDPRAKVYWSLQIGITIAVIVCVLLGLMFFISGIRPYANVALAAVLIIGLIVLIIAPQHKFRFHRWEVTDDAVFVSAGWLWREWRVAPLSRIQTIDVQYGPLQQQLQLATLIVTTASAAGPIKIEGLHKTTAAQLNEQLTALTKNTPGDAT